MFICVRNTSSDIHMLSYTSSISHAQIYIGHIVRSLICPLLTIKFYWGVPFISKVRPNLRVQGPAPGPVMQLRRSILIVTVTARAGRRDARFDSPHSLRLRGIFRPMSNEHVSTWVASVYTVHVTMFPCGSACVYIVHVTS